MIFLQYPPKEALCSLSISPFLNKYINDFAILINGPPQVMLLSLDLYKHLIDIESIGIDKLTNFKSNSSM